MGPLYVIPLLAAFAFISKYEPYVYDGSNVVKPCENIPYVYVFVNIVESLKPNTYFVYIILPVTVLTLLYIVNRVLPTLDCSCDNVSAVISLHLILLAYNVSINPILFTCNVESIRGVCPAGPIYTTFLNSTLFSANANPFIFKVFTVELLFTIT